MHYYVVETTTLAQYALQFATQAQAHGHAAAVRPCCARFAAKPPPIYLINKKQFAISRLLPFNPLHIKYFKL
jgi:hypothetical protein